MKKILLFTLFLSVFVFNLEAQDGLPGGNYKYINKGKNITETLEVMIEEDYVSSGGFYFTFFYSSTQFAKKRLILVEETMSETETYPTELGQMSVVYRSFKFENNPTKYQFKCYRDEILRTNPDKSISTFTLSSE
jgi:hypothetical protein